MLTFKAVIAMVLASAITNSATQTQDPMLKPIAAQSAARWLTEQPPLHIYGNTWLVGFGGLNVALIRTNDGLILIDGALPQAVPSIEANVRKLGFRLSDVKFILSTEPHYDHAGGLAALVRDTGATVISSVDAAVSLRTGPPDRLDPQGSDLLPFPAVKRLRTIGGGSKITLGDVVVHAVSTPGHTSGSMSWRWRSCEGQRCANMVFGSSLNPISSDGWKFTAPAHRRWVNMFRSSFAAMRALPCDILLTAHPDASGGDEKAERLQVGATPNPCWDPGACRTYADTYAKLLDARLSSGN